MQLNNVILNRMEKESLEGFQSITINKLPLTKKSSYSKIKVN